MTEKSDPASSPPEHLPGRSSVRVYVLGYLLIATAALGNIPLIFESDTGSFEAAYIAIILISVAMLAVVGAIVINAAAKKERAEIAAGYTTSTKIADRHPELWVLDYRNFRVARRPAI